MQLTAVFESWHIGDGNYPPLYVGQPVNLSFEMEVTKFEVASPNLPEVLIPLGSAEYRFCGTILRAYPREGWAQVIVIQSADFRFYIEQWEPVQYEVGTKVTGLATLLLDHYAWVEFLDTYPDPPNLFYNLTVTRIQKVQVPEKFIVRSSKSTSSPCRLSPEDYSTANVVEVSTMQGQDFTGTFYLVDFDMHGVENEIIPHTFI